MDAATAAIVAFLFGLLVGVGTTAGFTIRAALKDIRELSASLNEATKDTNAQP